MKAAVGEKNRQEASLGKERKGRESSLPVVDQNCAGRRRHKRPARALPIQLAGLDGTGRRAKGVPLRALGKGKTAHGTPSDTEQDRPRAAEKAAES